MSRPKIMVAMMIGGTVALIGLCPVSLRADPPNVLLISLDSVRADHLHCCGYERETSPNLDRLASQGLLFENVIATSSWTIPSHMSVFTGLYPSQHGVTDTHQVLREGIPTLAEVLQDNGYATAAFVTGPALDHRFGFGRGFQFYDDYSVAMMAGPDPTDEDQLSIGKTLNQRATNHFITGLASRWLRQNREEPFLLFLHYWDVHYDYIAPPPFEKRFDPEYSGKEDGRDLKARQPLLETRIAPEDLKHLIARYDGEIAHTDDQVGHILKVLDETGLTGNTLVIVFSDHGDGFLEHGKLLHGNTLYDEVIRVPLFMRLPGELPEGERFSQNISHVDILPTILEIAGVPAVADIQGASLIGDDSDQARKEGRILLSELHTHGLWAFVWRDMKVVFNRKGTKECLTRTAGGECLVDEHELMAAMPSHVRESLELLESLNAFVPETSSDEMAPNSDEDHIRRLRSMGYVQ